FRPPPPHFLYKPPAGTGLPTLSLHDALPISGPPTERGHPHGHRRSVPVDLVRADRCRGERPDRHALQRVAEPDHLDLPDLVLRADRKSTRLNSSHVSISYAVFRSKNKQAYGS